MREIIFITKQGTKVKRKDNQIIVLSGEEKVAAFPINRIDRLFLFGNVQITTPAITFLLSKNVEIYLLSAAGNLKGIITNTKLESNYNLRLQQYKAYSSEAKTLKLAKLFIYKKIISIEDFTGENLTHLKKALEQAKTYKEILGIEGTVSMFFFGVFKSRLLHNNELKFTRREYKPAKDPVNALLSLTYSLFYSLLFSFLKAKGFDPYIGFLHKKRGTHAVLVSDFMEFFRTDLSRFVLAIFNKQILTFKEFKSTRDGVYLNEEGKKVFFPIFKKNYIDDRKYISMMEKAVNSFIKALNELE